MPIRTLAAAHPDKPAVIMEPSGVTLSYAELEANSARLANLLRASGLAHGDHIAVLMENHVRYMEIVFAALRSGLYITAVNRFLPPSELAYILADCEAKALVTSTYMLPLAAQAIADIPQCAIRLAVGGAGEGFADYDAAIASHDAEPPPSLSGDAMLYSSGTTGRPKGIKRDLTEGPYATGTARPDVSAYDMNGDTVYLSPAPLYHAAPLAFVTGALLEGGTVVSMEKFDPVDALALIGKHRITHSQWVPTMFVRMLKLPPEARAGHDLSSHRCAIHAAAPCPVEVKRDMIAWWGPVLEEYYAATERIGATRISSAEWLAHPGSVGQAAGDARLRICGEDGAEVGPGEDGVIYFEQPSAAFIYHNDPEKTASSRHPDNDNWLTVGDIGHVDAEGYLYLTDRKSFMIISGGVNIYPQGIENALIMHPAVMDVAVLGVPHPEMGEEVKAVVQLRPGLEASASLTEELLAYVRDRVARYAVPRSIDYVAELPRLPTGKLYKKALRDQYAATAAVLA